MGQITENMLVVNAVKTGENLDRMRKSKGLDVLGICKAIGVSRQAVYGWLEGRRVPSVDNLVILAQMLGTTMDDIIITERREVVKKGGRCNRH